VGGGQEVPSFSIIAGRAAAVKPPLAGKPLGRRGTGAKSQITSPKSETNQNQESRIFKTARAGLGSEIRDLRFPIGFALRISDFGFRWVRLVRIAAFWTRKFSSCFEH
jgi:hypothetical protein